MISRRPRASALALVSTILLVACSGEAEAGATTSGAGGGANCAEEIDAELAMETMGLLNLSESDYPFETVELADPQGSGTITPAHLLALLAMDPLLKTETRTIPVFFDDLLNNSPDSAQYQMVLDALQAELTDLTMIRIIPAPPHSSEIQVHVLGRTTCGEIAGLKTVAIET
jgi:nuclease A inhibitor-like protein